MGTVVPTIIFSVWFGVENIFVKTFKNGCYELKKTNLKTIDFHVNN